MELIISHHWRLPNAVLIPVLQIRLSHCFQKGLSQSVDIPSHDWASLYGDSLPDRMLKYIVQRDDVDSIPILQIRLGNAEVFEVLQKEWYVQKNILFVSIEISNTNLDMAIRFWLHEMALKQA